MRLSSLLLNCALANSNLFLRANVSRLTLPALALSLLILAQPALAASSTGSTGAKSAASAASESGWHCARDGEGEWTCVENEAISASPRYQSQPQLEAPAPQPAPEPAAATTTDTSRMEQMVEQRSNAGAQRQQEAAARAAADARAAAARQRSASQAAAASARAAAQTPTAGSPADGPEANARVGITDLPDEYFTVQLLALTSRDALEKFAKDNKLFELSAARIGSGGTLRYVLLMGAYPTADAARNAAELLPDYLKKIGPWIRTLGSLKKAMREGDRLAAAAGPD